MQDALNVTWQGKMAFEANVGSHKIVVDADPQFGGEGRGPKPKPLLLVALAGCTGMDVVSLCEKMRVPIEGLNIRVESDMADDHPKKYTAIKVIYEFRGKDLPLDKLQKAVSMSEEKYCGVSATLKGSVDLQFEIQVIPS